ncbi:MAG: hypothetical protein Q4G07_05695 [Oscillospiraceae bacterium]|nr:hypothetical protein [Oscillospiraceae bacterium]
MKKISVLCLCLCLLTGLLAACGQQRSALTAEEFAKKASEASYTTSDRTADMNGYVEACILAQKPEYQVEFFIVATDEQAARAYENNVAKLEEAKAASEKSTEEKGGSGEDLRYEVTTDTEYLAVSRIGKTFVFTRAPLSQKEEVISFLKTLPY